MKRLSMITMCMLAMLAACLSAKAQEITITLYPGNTWISYPGSEMLDINTALGDFVPAEGDIIKSQFTSSTYRNGYWRGGVTHFMPGWGYMYYSNRTEVVSFVFGETAPQLTVTTAEPTDITANSAVSGGSITSNDGNYIYVFQKGICWATHPNPIVINDFYTENGEGLDSFTVEMNDLDLDTVYYVRAYVVTADGTYYGEEKSFTTRDGIPMVSLDSITNIRGNSAICHGTVVDNGGLDVISRGVCWSIFPNPTISDSLISNGSGLGNFTSAMTGMDASTTYYVRAYASTSQAIVYSEEMSFTTCDGIPDVSTAEVTNISATGATCGGTVITDGGLSIIARGVCWSTSHNPTLDDSHTTDGTGTGGFSSSLTGLLVNTTYYVRAYASNSQVTVYGDELSFIPDYNYVDLGLPSGTLWAIYNVGADTPEDYGTYFAWGETQSGYCSWSSYDYSIVSSYGSNTTTLTKYCNNASYGYNGFTDDLTILLPEDDAATANWGVNWRMPTKEEWQELQDNCTSVWTTQNGVSGRCFTATNGNSLFLPAAGYRDYGSNLFLVGNGGYYWSSSLNTDNPYRAWYFNFNVSDYRMLSKDRYVGQSVRAVRSAQQK